MAEINGQVPVKDRSGIVNDFNRVNAGKEVMLLSLGAGGVGLNLIGGNHLFLLVKFNLKKKIREIIKKNFFNKIGYALESTIGSPSL